MTAANDVAVAENDDDLVLKTVFGEIVSEPRTGEDYAITFPEPTSCPHNPPAYPPYPGYKPFFTIDKSGAKHRGTITNPTAGTEWTYDALTDDYPVFISGPKSVDVNWFCDNALVPNAPTRQIGSTTVSFGPARTLTITPPAGPAGSLVDVSSDDPCHPGTTAKVRMSTDFGKAPTAAGEAVVAGDGTWVVPDLEVPSITRDQPMLVKASCQQPTNVWNYKAQYETSEFQIDPQTDVFTGKDGKRQYRKGSAVRRVPAGQTATFPVTIMNRGSSSHEIDVTGTPPNTRFSVRYLATDGSDITSAITEGTHLVGPLSAGDDEEIRVKVKPKSSAPAGSSLAVKVRASATDGNDVNDVLRLTTRVK